jgi:hypothetical protein
MSISKLSVTEGYSNESEEYFPINENYYDILSDCKSLLIEQKMNSIRIIFKEIVDAQSIKRQIYINGIVDMANKILYSHFLNTFLDYISDLDSFITLPLIFQEYDKKPKNENENNNIYDKVFYVQSAKRQNIYNINGNIIYFEDLIEKNEIKKNLILLIFWQDIKDIESNIKQYLNIAKNYNKYISVIFIYDIGDFLKKKSFLQEKNYYRILNVDNPKENEDSNINNNIYFVFDDKFLHNKYFVIKFPWFVILNKNNEIFDSGILRIEEIQDKIENFLGENPESKQNINNLFWIDLSNKIKLNLIRKINLKLANNNYKNIHFYIETNSSISCQELMSSFDIDAYFIGSLKYQDFNVFKGFAEKICKEEKIQNIHYNIEH